jgi:glycosyltransferase involved in cell wall biosynthesis
LFPFSNVISHLARRFPAAMSACRRLYQRNEGSWIVSRLAQVIKDWQPHLIHTIGIDPAGFYAFEAIRRQSGTFRGKWVLQVLGGADLELTRFQDAFRRRIAIMADVAACIMCCNQRNVDHLLSLGVPVGRISPTRIPGSGGIDVDSLSTGTEPSSRRRLILWPKGYEAPWSKALPVLEALHDAWPQIRPCRIVVLAASPELRAWLPTLPDDMRAAIAMHDRVPLSAAHAFLRQARVMLAPTLIDGLQISLLEAMAAGALPIVSPLSSFPPALVDGQNALFARNLYPNEISAALCRAMADDALVDQAAAANLPLVRGIADLHTTAPAVVAVYRDLLES